MSPDPLVERDELIGLCTGQPALPRPLKDVPGIVVETRRLEEEQQQSQTPVDEKVTTTPTSQP